MPLIWNPDETNIAQSQSDLTKIATLIDRTYKNQGAGAVLALNIGGLEQANIAVLLDAYLFAEKTQEGSGKEAVLDRLYGLARGQALDVTGVGRTDTTYNHRAFYMLMWKGIPQGLLTDRRRQDRLIFPINPEEFNFPTQRTTGTYDVVARAQAMSVGQRQLRVVSFSSFFPAVYDPDYCNGQELDKSPKESVQYIRDHMAGTAPINFGTIGEMVFPTMSVYVTNFACSYKSGHPSDVFFDIELTEANLPVISQIQTAGPGAPSTTEKKYTSRRGDTLDAIAKQFYGRGNGKYWTQIKQANPALFYQPFKVTPKNRDSWVKDSSPANNQVLKPGQHIVVPEIKPKR